MDMNKLFSVAGKTVLITGGSRGIGEMMAEAFVQGGAKVYITARKAEELNATATRLSSFGECHAVACDLATGAGISALVTRIKAENTALHVLINNAGCTWGASIETFPEQGWDKVMDLNVKTPFFLVQQLLPLLEAGASNEDPARVINIASVNGITTPTEGMDNYSYSASKAALIHLTRHLAATLNKNRINVNGIAPGFFPSKMTAHWLVEGNDKTLLDAVPRQLGTPEDAAGTAIYLSSRASAWVKGHTIVLDGGTVAQSG